MIETKEITQEEYDSLNSFDDIYKCACRLSNHTIWPATVYKVYGAEKFTHNDKYFLSWSHLVFKNQTNPYELLK